MRWTLDESYYPQLQQIVKDYMISISFYDPDHVAEHGFVLESSDKTGGGMELGENLGEEFSEKLKSFVKDEFTYADTH